MRRRNAITVFSCIGLIHKKTTEELNAFEASKLLEYKLYNLNLDSFSKRVNGIFRRNGGRDEIVYSMDLDIERTLSVTASVRQAGYQKDRPTESMGKGMRSIYMLSLLEAYEEEGMKNADIIMVEDPEIFLHPKLQKVSGDILYRLSKKNQVIFSTHSPNLLSNFNSRQIRQMFLDQDGFSAVRDKTDISAVLDDLGYSANDLMNVKFCIHCRGQAGQEPASASDSEILFGDIRQRRQSLAYRDHYDQQLYEYQDLCQSQIYESDLH